MTAQDGTVALAETRTRWTNQRGQVSDDEGEFGEGDLRASGA
jgi:hypothetical protein